MSNLFRGSQKWKECTLLQTILKKEEKDQRTLSTFRILKIDGEQESRKDGLVERDREGYVHAETIETSTYLLQSHVVSQVCLTRPAGTVESALATVKIKQIQTQYQLDAH